MIGVQKSMARTFTVSATPHLRDSTGISTIMYSVVAALMPALAGAVYFFGIQALVLTLLAVAACMITEGAIQKLTGRPLSVLDGSAIVTGILLAFNLPGGVSWWIPVIGGIFAIAVGKMIFGGLGNNPMNPALLGRVFLQVSWPVQMNSLWTAPRGAALDAESIATPLTVLKENMAVLKTPDSPSIETALANVMDINDTLMDLFIGRVSGCIGETSALLLLVGAAYLMYKRYVDWKIPFSYIATVGLLTWIFGGHDGFFTGMWLFHILSGGLIIGAFFMATDMVTSPITCKGQLLFGFGCGLLTVIIRLIGGYPEGVSYSILLMNLVVPLIDKFTRPTVFGKAK